MPHFSACGACQQRVGTRNCERGKRETSACGGKAASAPTISRRHGRRPPMPTPPITLANSSSTPTIPAPGGAPPAPADELVPGAQLGRYQIARLVGRGGMGCVYEAVHRDLGKRVAIKALLPALAGSAESRARFVREGQAAARIRHPHVVDVTDVVADGALTYLVMEYLDGQDLAARIAERGALPLRETADILLPVVAAIAAAHEHGVTH